MSEQIRVEANQPSVDVEKNALNESGYVVNTDSDSDSNGRTGSPTLLKKAKDGKTVLIPQPSDAPEDPLNWSWAKKHSVFACLLPGCFLTDWVITYGTTVFEPQAMEWHMTLPGVANSIAGSIFMQGPGGLLAVPLCQKYGRLPVLFWSQLFCLVCTIGASQATTYAGFTAARTLQGFFGAPPQVIGLSIIYDLFFFQERARKINVWAACFLAGPYLGPFVSAFIIEKLTWQNTFGVLCGFYGFSLLLIICCGDETLYDRQNPQTRQKGVMGRVSLLIGITGAKESSARPSLWKFTKDLGLLIVRPYMFLPTFGFVMFMTMWTIGIVSTISEFVLPPPYAFSETQFALLFLAPMIGTLLAELWGRWFNNYLQDRYIRTHDGVHVPENRLVGVYPAWVIGIGGLVLFGQAFERTLTWPAIAFGWGMTCFCTLGTTTAISAYLLDVFPRQAAAASAWILMARVAGGFSVNYFQAPWVARDGAGVTFGIQAGIIGVAIFSIVAMQIWAGKWRKLIPVPGTGEL